MPQSMTGQEKDLNDSRIDLFLQSYNFMHYDGFTPGEADLALGVAELLKRSRQASFPFLSANLMDRQSDKPVFTPYVIKTSGGMKIGIFAVMADGFDLPSSSADGEQYFLENPVDAARKIISDLKAKGCRVIICLAHMPENEQRKLAQAAPEIQFIISGHDVSLKPEMEQVNQVEILRSGAKGEYLGQLEFFLQEDRLFYHYEVIPLDRTLPNQSQVAGMVTQYKSRIQALINEE